MMVESVTSWDEIFFLNFLCFRNKIHSNLEASFPETIQDYTKFFSPDSVFQNDIAWEAFIVRDQGEVVAKGILCWRKNSSTGNLGFVDWENNIHAAEFLINAVRVSCLKNAIKHIKSPVDLNFFVKYRIRLPSGEKPFWGEPIYPDYYHELYQQTGFKTIGHWDTYKVNKYQAIIDYFNKRLKLSQNPEGAHHKKKDKELRTSIRCLNMKNWNEEMKTIHTLFLESYKNMPEWEPISFEQFKIIYDDFKYIVHPWYSYIIELKGRPVGFSINFADPLSILAKYKNSKPTKLQKLWILIRLRLNISCFLIAHVGKIPGPNGEEIKGVQIQASRRIQLWIILMRKVLVTFQMTNSPSRRSFEGTRLRKYAEYVLYGQDIL